MNLLSHKEIFILWCGLIISSSLASGLTYFAVKNIYGQVLGAMILEQKNNEVAKMMLHKKLNQCAVEFGTYVATKGKNGQRYFEHY